MYSFEKHARLERTTTIYSPHVLVLEGIFALHDQRVLDLLDLKIFTEADSDLCLSRRCKPFSVPPFESSLISDQWFAMYESVGVTLKAASSSGSNS